jgi:uncharacterized protein YceK
MKFLLLLVAAVLLTSGCAAIERANHSGTERLLSAAGFRVLPANTSERQDSLASLPPWSIVRKFKGDEPSYVYADPDHGVLFIGDEKAYTKFQQLAVDLRIANDNMLAARMNLNAAQQWNDWGCWGAPGFGPRWH